MICKCHKHIFTREQKKDQTLKKLRFYYFEKILSYFNLHNTSEKAGKLSIPKKTLLEEHFKLISLTENRTVT